MLGFEEPTVCCYCSWVYHNKTSKFKVPKKFENLWADIYLLRYLGLREVDVEMVKMNHLSDDQSFCQCNYLSDWLQAGKREDWDQMSSIFKLRLSHFKISIICVLHWLDSKNGRQIIFASIRFPRWFDSKWTRSFVND